MKIKRYTAGSMRAALALVRAEQGPDAVILSSRRGEEGIEVIAAIDYDEALFTETNAMAAAARAEAMKEAMAASSARRPEPVLTEMTAVPTLAAPAAVVPVAPARPAAPRSDFAVTLMQREMHEIRKLIQTGMAGITWNDKRLREPVKAQVLEQLSALDIAPDVAAIIAEQTPKRSRLEDRANLSLALLLMHLNFVEDTTPMSGGVTALLGPTGAGKTTTIAKLAARWCHAHGNKDLALISTDSYRIGAREQLMAYARILDAPMHTANSAKQLSILLQRLSKKKLILIDTAGMGPRDARLPDQLAELEAGAPGAKVLMALPAQAEAQALEELVRAYAPAKPASCIITKIDEASSLGGVLSAAIRHKLKIAYVCDGQKVPEDLHAAHQRRIWLAKLAHQMKAGAPAKRDDAYMARHFAGVPSHA